LTQIGLPVATSDAGKNPGPQLKSCCGGWQAVFPGGHPVIPYFCAVA